MIQLKTAKEIAEMRLACQISAEVLKLAGEAVKPGVTTAQIDKVIYNYIVSQGAKPNFKGYGGFPGSACISVNDTVIHGIPSKHIVLQEGDIVSIDTGAAVHGWNGDNAATFACGAVSDRAQRIMDVTKEALARGIAAAQPGDVYKRQLYADKVMPVCPKCGKATRVGHTEKDGKKVRVCKKCGAEF